MTLERAEQFIRDILSGRVSSYNMTWSQFESIKLVMAELDRWRELHGADDPEDAIRQDAIGQQARLLDERLNRIRELEAKVRCSIPWRPSLESPQIGQPTPADPEHVIPKESPQ